MQRGAGRYDTLNDCVLTSVCAAPTKSKGAAFPMGLVVLATMLLALLVYMGTGTLVLRYYRAPQRVPHEAFWRDLPGLIRDGAAVTLAFVLCQPVRLARRDYEPLQ